MSNLPADDKKEERPVLPKTEAKKKSPRRSDQLYVGKGNNGKFVFILKKIFETHDQVDLTGAYGFGNAKVI